MHIDGPLKIGIVAPDNATGTELHIDFTPDFRGLSLSDQGDRFREYINTLGEQIAALPADDPNRAGMQTVEQIAKQLLPHVVEGELAMDETIVVGVESEVPSVSLTDFLN